MFVLFLGLRVKMFELRLQTKQATIITENRQCSNTQGIYLYGVYQIQIRVSTLDETVTKVTDFLPNGLDIRINGKECPLPQDNKSPIINCTQFFKLNPNILNKIHIKWISDGKNYVMAVYIVKKLSSANLLNTLKYKRLKSSEETRNIIQSYAVRYSDLITSFRVSLVCPLSRMRIKIPVKSINCDHLQCFDANEYILRNEKNPTWICPVCDKSCLYDDLLIDAYFLDILTNPTIFDSFNDIEILLDGSWRLFNNSTTLNNSGDDNKDE